MSPNVVHSADDYIFVDETWIDRLTKTASQSPLRRARLCMHHNAEDAVHEMFIVLMKNCLFRPHRHRAKSESFHIISGELCIIIFSDDGVPVACRRLASPGTGHPFFYRLSVSAWHAIVPLTDSVAYIETTAGPFVPDAAEFAPFAPSDEVGLEAFLKRIVDRHLQSDLGDDRI